MPCSVPASLDHNGGSFLWLLVGQHWLRTSSRHSGCSLIIFWLLKTILSYAAKTVKLFFSAWPFSLAGLISSYYSVHPESMHHIPSLLSCTEVPSITLSVLSCSWWNLPILNTANVLKRSDPKRDHEWGAKSSDWNVGCWTRNWVPG